MQAAQEAKKVIDDLRANHQKYKNASDEEIAELRKKTNPYAIVVPETKSFVNMSIVNFRDVYFRRLHMTSLIGFLFQLIDEYDEFDVSDFNMDEKKARPLVKSAIKTFAERHFKYNPNYHVKTAFKEGVNDPERSGKFSEMKEKMDSGVSTAELDVGKLREMLKYAPDSDLPNLRTQLLEALDAVDSATALTYSTTVELSNQCKQMAKLTNNFTHKVRELKSTAETEENHKLSRECDNFLAALADYEGHVDTTQSTAQKLSDSLYKFSSSLPTLSNVRHVYNEIPSGDVFYHFDRYITNNYEQLREAVNILYSEKPDLEYGIQYFDWFDTSEQAEAHRNKYESLFPISVLTIENDGWTVLGSFKKNVDRETYYNKNTEVLKMVFEQAEYDQRLGQDLMKRRVKSAKTKNIMEDGPDDPGLANYKKALSTVEQLGAKQVMTEEEKEEIAKAKLCVEMAEVPKDAIQYYKYHTDENGNFVKEIEYTEAEEPQELVADSGTTSTKRIRSKKGDIASIEDLAKLMKKNT